MERYLKEHIIKDINKKMIFITGPRQVGKTYFARSIEKHFKNPVYLNYDNPEHALVIRKRQWLLDADLIIFDEIHKMKNWKNFIKGVFDTKPREQAILVTGSASLDFFRHSGESLAGRYFHYRLNPLSVKELNEFRKPADALRKLNILGGFPEPFLSNSEAEARRWRKQYFTEIIREDILDVTRIHEIKTIQLLLELLRKRVGSPISYLSLSRDLQISPHTVKKYIEILESLYLVFNLRPFHKNVARAILKEPKIYFYDSGIVEGDESIKFENTVAMCLTKHAQYLEDLRGENIKVNYLRTKQGHEIDFVITREGRAEIFVEAKLTDTNISKQLLYFSNKFKDSSFIQLVQNTGMKKQSQKVKLFPAAEWLSKLSA